MKKLIAFLTALFIASLQLVMAGTGEKAPFAVQQAFENRFGKSKAVVWAKVHNDFVGTMEKNGEKVQVYYTEEGEFFGTGRRIAKDNLPMSTTDVLAEDYAGYVLTTAYEFTHERGGATYYMTLAGAKQTLIVTGNGAMLRTEKKIKN